MKKVLNLIAFAMLGIASISCVEVDPYLFADTGMAYVREGMLISDSGLRYIIEQDQTDGGYKDATRIVYSGYATRKGEGSTYYMRLVDYAAALYKECVIPGEIDEEEIGSDPIEVAGAWYGGSCLNLRCNFLYVPNVKATHTINLEYDVTRSHQDTVFVTLRHNAHEHGDMEKYELQATEVYTYASFPCSYFFASGRDKVVLALTYSWFADKEVSYLSPTIEHTECITLEKD